MKILFVGSSLEPGRDGVGDYLTRLADACSRQGHTCALVGLHDPFVSRAETSDPDSIARLRLPSLSTWAERLGRFTDFRDRFQPDWISLHLVPYAFHPKGVLFGMRPVFRALCAGTSLHLMFHELYIGAGTPSSLRHRLVGKLQAAGLRKLLRDLQPALVTTSNPVYAAMLRQLGAEAEVLPLFGNIPVLTAGEFPELEELLPTSGITRETRGAWRIGVIFGAIHDQWQPEPFLSRAIQAYERAGKRSCFVLAGRSSRTTWDRMQAPYVGRATFIDAGEQPAALISALLQNADFGVATSPWQLIGKSGTAAAMLDHGLPVVVTRDDFQPAINVSEPPIDDPLLHRLADLTDAELVAGLTRRLAQPRADAVAAQLGARLQELAGATP